MDVNGRFEQRMQHYQSLLREAEENRLARELGFTEANTLYTIATGLWNKLSRRFSPDVASRETGGVPIRQVMMNEE